MKKVLLLIMLGILLVGCGKVKEPGVQAPSMFGGAEATPEPSDLGVLNIAFCGAPEFQPHTAQNAQSRKMLEFVYEPLFYINAQKEVIPVLAERAEASGTDVSVYLKPGIKWHDGSDLTAADVVYTINLITGGNSVFINNAIDSAWAEGNNCVRLKLSRAFVKPETVLNFPIVKKNTPSNITSPVGTGPYMYNGKGTYDTYTLKPFDGYHGEKKEFNQINMITNRDTGREKDLFKAGETDIIYLSHSDLMSYTPRANTKLNTYPTNQMIYVGFNANRVPPSVRRSIYYATDNKGITEKVFGRIAEASIFTDHDMKRAEAELEADGYVRNNYMYEKDGKGIKLNIIVQPDGRHEELANELAGRLKNLGITCNIRQTSRFYGELTEGDYDIVIGTWAVTGDLWDMLKGGNVLRYENELMDKMYMTTGETQEFYNEFLKEMPFIPLAYRCDAVVTSSKITKDLVLTESFYLGGL